jgi:act minimal PKS acyl carrier protein
MKDMTLEDLRQILTDCAGQDEVGDLGADILDIPFTDLGYDSLALLETASQVERQVGVALDDDLVARLQTPRQFLAQVNSSLAVAHAVLRAPAGLEGGQR